MVQGGGAVSYEGGKTAGVMGLTWRGSGTHVESALPSSACLGGAVSGLKGLRVYGLGVKVEVVPSAPPFTCRRFGDYGLPGYRLQGHGLEGYGRQDYALPDYGLPDYGPKGYGIKGHGL